MALSRNQKQLILLGALLAAILFLLFTFIFKPPAAPTQQAAYTPPAVDTRMPTDLVQRPEYRRLELRVDLPVVPGAMGRDNPFEPY